MRVAWLGAGSTLKTWLRGGGLRPVVVVVFLAAFFVAFPDRNFSLNDARATSLPACVNGVGLGGTRSDSVASTIGGHGCVVIKYVVNGSAHYETFNYTGADQAWTVPSGVTSASFFLLGAGGGASIKFASTDVTKEDDVTMALTVAEDEFGEQGMIDTFLFA